MWLFGYRSTNVNRERGCLFFSSVRSDGRGGGHKKHQNDDYGRKQAAGVKGSNDRNRNKNRHHIGLSNA